MFHYPGVRITLYLKGVCKIRDFDVENIAGCFILKQITVLWYVTFIPFLSCIIINILSKEKYTKS